MPRICLVIAFAALTGCASTPPSIDTDRRETPPIEARPLHGSDRFRVITEGLEPEIAVEGVRAHDIPFARQLLEATLAALPPGEAPRAGAILDLRLGRTSARVQLVSATGSALLIVDLPPTRGAVQPKNALATAAFSRAYEAYEAGEGAAALQLALASVRLYPGDPLEAGAPDRMEGGNQQNHLAWALLAHLTDGAAQERWYVGALERSTRYLAAELGATPSALLEPERGEVLAQARAIVEEDLAVVPRGRRRGGPAGPVEFPSPIREADGTRAPVLLPAGFQAFYTGEAAAQLQNPEFLGLVVDAFDRLRADPVELLVATMEIRSLYLPVDLFAPWPRGGRPAEKMLSSIIADAARKAAAGLSNEEIAATLGARADPIVLAAAYAKMRAQRDRETQWYAEALGAATK